MPQKPKGTEDSKQAANMRCFDRMCEMHPKPKGTEDSANSSPNNSTALSCEMHQKPKGTEDLVALSAPDTVPVCEMHPKPKGTEDKVPTNSVGRYGEVRDAPKAERH